MWSVIGHTMELSPFWGCHIRAYALQSLWLMPLFSHQKVYFIMQNGTSKLSQRVRSSLKKTTKNKKQTNKQKTTLAWISASKFSNPGLYLELCLPLSHARTFKSLISEHLSYYIYKVKRWNLLISEALLHSNTPKFCNFKPIQSPGWTQVPLNLWYSKTLSAKGKTICCRQKAFYAMVSLCWTRTQLVS